MKVNLIPGMSAIQLLDRDGCKAQVDIKMFSFQGDTHVFMADRANVGRASIGRNGGVYIPQLAERLALDRSRSYFYRHVFMPASGSLFGRFELEWQQHELTSYTFSMLNNLDQGQQLKQLLTAAEPVVLSYSQLKNVMPISA